MNSFEGVTSELEFEQDTQMRQFATGERQKLERVGYDTAGTVALMRTAGPGHCVRSVILAEVCIERILKKVKDLEAASCTLGVISRLVELGSNAVDSRNSLFKFFPGLKDTEIGKDLIHCRSDETMARILKGSVLALTLKGVKLPPDFRETANEPVGKGLLAEALKKAKVVKK